MLPRCACRMRTVSVAPVCVGICSTFQTPCPPLPRFCLMTLAPDDCSRRGNAAPNSALLRYRCVSEPQPRCFVRYRTSLTLQDYVGVRADPGTARGDVAQKRIECGSGLALMDRIDPH